MEDIYPAKDKTSQNVIVMNLCEGVQLHEWLLKDPTRHFTFKEIVDLSTKIFEPIVYLHEEVGLIHMDLHAENYMVDDKENIKLIDFGLARLIGKDGVLQDEVGTNEPRPKYEGGPIVRRGTAFKAPERILYQKYSFSAETWQAGVIIAFITNENRKSPFNLYSFELEDQLAYN
jgi:serine/threonine protein kinase